MSAIRRPGKRHRYLVLLPWCGLLLLLWLFLLELKYISSFERASPRQKYAEGAIEKPKEKVATPPTVGIPSVEGPQTTSDERSGKIVSLEEEGSHNSTDGPFKLHPKLHKFVMMTHEKKPGKSFGQAMTETKNKHKGRREGKGESMIAHLEGEHGGEWDW